MPIINSVITTGGIQPSGTKQITTNGTHDVSTYANADVQVPTTAPAHYVEKTVDRNGKLVSGTNIINLNGVSDLGDNVLANAYNQVSFPANTSVDLSNLTTVSGNSACQSMFRGCTGLTSVDLSNLTTVSGNSACSGMFSSCMGLTSVDLSSLTTISGFYALENMFSSCRGITSVDLSSLTIISGQNACSGMFVNCTGITIVKLNVLNTMTQQFSPSYSKMFGDCIHLESVEFGGLTASTFASKTDQIAYLFNEQTGSQATNGCTVHFPSNFDPSDPNHTFDASTLTGYPTFGGSASYIHVAFDLPATE